MSEKEKMNVNTAPAVDTSTGTAEDVEAIMKKYDRESNTRIWEGVPKKVVRYLLAAFALLMVYMNLFANWDERVRRSLFVGIVIILSFLVYPAKKGSTKKNHIPIYDIVLMVLGAGAYFYFVINFKTIIGHATRISQLEVIVGIIGILVLAETCRRVVGIPILCVATVFIGYAFYSGLGAGRAFPQVLKSIVYNLLYHQRRHRNSHRRLLHVYRAVYPVRRIPGGHRDLGVLYPVGQFPGGRFHRRSGQGGRHLLGPLRNGIRKFCGEYSYHRLRDDPADEKDGLQGRICRSC